MNFRLTAISALFIMLFTYTSCRETSKKAQDKIEKAAQKTEHTLDKAADKIQKAADEADRRKAAEEKKEKEKQLHHTP